VGPALPSLRVLAMAHRPPPAPPPGPPGPPPAGEEMNSKFSLDVAGPRQAARLFGRAFLLRCPNCGGGKVLQHWLKLKVKCPTCGLRLERGEHDHFAGSMFILFTLTGVLVLGAMVVTMLVTAPTVPWDLLVDGLPIVTLVAIPLLFPFSKLLWLAFDLMMRPATPEELAWHRAAETEWSSEQSPR